MGHRPVHICFFLFTAVIAFGVPAFSDPQCKPVVGSFEAHTVTEDCLSPLGLCTAGRVWGGIRLRGDFDPVAGTTSGDYLGSICTP